MVRINPSPQNPTGFSNGQLFSPTPLDGSTQAALDAENQRLLDSQRNTGFIGFSDRISGATDKFFSGLGNTLLGTVESAYTFQKNQALGIFGTADRYLNDNRIFGTEGVIPDKIASGLDTRITTANARNDDSLLGAGAGLLGSFLGFAPEIALTGGVGAGVGAGVSKIPAIARGLTATGGKKVATKIGVFASEEVAELGVIYGTNALRGDNFELSKWDYVSLAIPFLRASPAIRRAVSKGGKASNASSASKAASEVYQTTDNGGLVAKKVDDIDGISTATTKAVQESVDKTLNLENSNGGLQGAPSSVLNDVFFDGNPPTKLDQARSKYTRPAVFQNFEVSNTAKRGLANAVNVLSNDTRTAARIYYSADQVGDVTVSKVAGIINTLERAYPTTTFLNGSKDLTQIKRLNISSQDDQRKLGIRANNAPQSAKAQNINAVVRNTGAGRVTQEVAAIAGSAADEGNLQKGFKNVVTQQNKMTKDLNTNVIQQETKDNLNDVSSKIVRKQSAAIDIAAERPEIAELADNTLVTYTGDLVMRPDGSIMNRTTGEIIAANKSEYTDKAFLQASQSLSVYDEQLNAYNVASVQKLAHLLLQFEYEVAAAGSIRRFKEGSLPATFTPEQLSVYKGIQRFDNLADAKKDPNILKTATVLANKIGTDAITEIDRIAKAVKNPENMTKQIVKMRHTAFYQLMKDQRGSVAITDVDFFDYAKQILNDPDIYDNAKAILFNDTADVVSDGVQNAKASIGVVLDNYKDYADKRYAFDQVLEDIDTQIVLSASSNPDLVRQSLRKLADINKELADPLATADTKAKLVEDKSRVEAVIDDEAVEMARETNNLIPEVEELNYTLSTESDPLVFKIFEKLQEKITSVIDESVGGSSRNLTKEITGATNSLRVFNKERARRIVKAAISEEYYNYDGIDRINLHRAVESGNAPAGPVRDLLDEMHELAASLGIPQGYVKNFMPRFFKDPQNARKSGLNNNYVPAYDQMFSTISRKYKTIDESMNAFMKLTGETDPTKIFKNANVGEDLEMYISNFFDTMIDVHTFKALSRVEYANLDGASVKIIQKVTNDDQRRVLTQQLGYKNVVNDSKLLAIDQAINAKPGSDLVQYYMPAEQADFFNQHYMLDKSLQYGEIARIANNVFNKTSNLNSNLQELVFSGGGPFTPANALSVVQARKAVQAGNFTEIKGIMKSFSLKEANKTLKENADEIAEMMVEDVKISLDGFYEEGLIKELKQSLKDAPGISGKTKEFWSKAFNEPTFGRMLTMARLSTYKGQKAKYLSKGFTETEARRLAAQTVNNFEGTKSFYDEQKIDPLRDNVVGTFFVAPKYRAINFRSMFNSAKSFLPSNITDPTFSLNRRRIAGLGITWAMYQAVNYGLNQQFMGDNPGRTKNKLLIGGVEVPFWDSQTTAIRLGFNGIKSAVQLDGGGLADAGSGTLSLLVNPIKEGLLNENFFGEEIYETEEGSLTKYKGFAAHIAKNWLNQPLISGIIEFGSDLIKDDEEASLKKFFNSSLEPPFKFVDTSKAYKNEFSGVLDDIKKDKDKLEEELKELERGTWKNPVLREEAIDKQAVLIDEYFGRWTGEIGAIEERAGQSITTLYPELSTYIDDAMSLDRPYSQNDLAQSYYDEFQQQNTYDTRAKLTNYGIDTRTANQVSKQQSFDRFNQANNAVLELEDFGKLWRERNNQLYTRYYSIQGDSPAHQLIRKGISDQVNAGVYREFTRIAETYPYVMQDEIARNMFVGEAKGLLLSEQSDFDDRILGSPVASIPF